MYQLIVKDHFDSAHYIKDYPGKCSRIHGHRWNIELVIEGRALDKLNMLIDFSKIKEQLNATIDASLDHFNLNESLNEEHLTAEFLAKWIYDDFNEYNNHIKNYGGRQNIKLVKITVYENPDCGATYME